jgi:hypothetical protein
MGGILPALNKVLLNGTFDIYLNAAFNTGMNQNPIDHDKALIDSLGGPAKLAEKLGYDKGGVQRVQNWTTRGIPPAVKLERPDLFLRELTGATEGATAACQSSKPAPKKKKPRRDGPSKSKGDRPTNKKGR